MAVSTARAARNTTTPSVTDARPTLCLLTPVEQLAPGATILETFEPLWPGEAARWVYTVRAGEGGAGPVVWTGSADDDAERPFVVEQATAFCEAHGLWPVAIRRGRQARPGPRRARSNHGAAVAAPAREGARRAARTG